MKKSESLNEFVSAEHTTESCDWAKAAGFTYLSAKDKDELNNHLTLFTVEQSEQSIILEVIADMDICKKAFQKYYHDLKK